MFQPASMSELAPASPVRPAGPSADVAVQADEAAATPFDVALEEAGTGNGPISTPPGRVAPGTPTSTARPGTRGRPAAGVDEKRSTSPDDEPRTEADRPKVAASPVPDAAPVAVAPTTVAIVSAAVAPTIQAATAGAVTGDSVTTATGTPPGPGQEAASLIPEGGRAVLTRRPTSTGAATTADQAGVGRAGSAAPAHRETPTPEARDARPATPATPALPKAEAVPATPADGDAPASAAAPAIRAPAARGLPATPATAAEPAVSATSNASAAPAAPAEPAGSATPNASAALATPAEPAGSATPHASAAPATPAEPAGSATPNASAAPATPATAALPAGPRDPRQGSEPDERRSSTPVRNRVRSEGVEFGRTAEPSIGTPAAGADDPAIPGEVIVRPAVADAVERLLGQVVKRLRTVDTTTGPGLEATFRDPDLGSVRLVVAGLPGEVIRATLTATSPEAVLALRQAIEHHRAIDDLAGIALQVRQDVPTASRRATAEPGLDLRPDARGGGPGQAFAGDGERRDQRRGADDPGPASAAPSILRPRSIAAAASRLASDRLGRAVDRIA
jgi:hypothetical protein